MPFYVIAQGSNSSGQTIDAYFTTEASAAFGTGKVMCPSRSELLLSN